LVFFGGGQEDDDDVTVEEMIDYDNLSNFDFFFDFFWGVGEQEDDDDVTVEEMIDYGNLATGGATGKGRTFFF